MDKWWFGSMISDPKLLPLLCVIAMPKILEPSIALFYELSSNLCKWSLSFQPFMRDQFSCMNSILHIKNGSHICKASFCAFFSSNLCLHFVYIILSFYCGAIWVILWLFDLLRDLNFPIGQNLEHPIPDSLTVSPKSLLLFKS